jgi:putative spermidine/putrescine transport system ATP-binding protein
MDLSAGEILLNDRPIQNVPAERRGFGMVFQNYALFPHLTVARNVGYGLEIRRIAKAERERRVQRTLERVQLEGYGNRYPAQLSGGQQQRLAIARTIVLEPALLLLDEPLSNLDANLRIEMRIEIKRLHHELGLTTLYVTHDQSEAMSLSDLVVVMRLGGIEQVGPPQAIYNAPHNPFVARFMGYVNRLPVELISQEERFWRVRTLSGEILQATRTSAESTGWQPGQKLVVNMRPEETLSDPALTTNRLRGRVQLVEYVGRTFEVLVRLEEDGTQLLVHSERPPSADEVIEFGVRPERLLLFSEDDAGAHTIPIPSVSPNVAARVER